MLLRWWAGRLTIRAFLAQGTRPCQGWSWGHLVAGFIPQEARPAAGMKAAVEGQAGQGSKCVLPSGSSAGSEFARHAWCVALHPETELGLELLCFSRKPGHQKEKSQNVSINNQGRWWSRGGGLRSGEQDLIPVGPGLPPAYLLGSFGAYLDGSWLGAEADRDVSWKGARRVVTWTPRSD